MQLRPVVWLPHHLAETMLDEADKWFELETGGTMMGYWAGANEVVVTKLIDAGPEARREPYGFEPDQQWQQAKINEHYLLSGRLDAYLGDWHTHPRAQSDHMSSIDKSCVRAVIDSPGARQPRPLMMLLIGEPGQWKMSPRVCTLERLLYLFPIISELRAAIRLF